MSKQECDFFIEKGEQVSFQEAKVNIDRKQVMVKGIRNNQCVLFKDDELAESVWAKIKPFVPETFWGL